MNQAGLETDGKRQADLLLLSFSWMVLTLTSSCSHDNRAAGLLRQSLRRGCHEQDRTNNAKNRADEAGGAEHSVFLRSKRWLVSNQPAYRSSLVKSRRCSDLFPVEKKIRQTGILRLSELEPRWYPNEPLGAAPHLKLARILLVLPAGLRSSTLPG